MEIYSSLVNFFQAGGLFMYPIVAVLALGVAIAVERYVYLTAARATNARHQPAHLETGHAAAD